jgi:hypothetical protein
MNALERIDVRVVRVSSTQRVSLHTQTLEILELKHEGFDLFADKPVAEQLALATIFRDAFDVLCVVAWNGRPEEESVDVEFSAGQIAQLQARRRDLALTVTNRLDTIEEARFPAERPNLEAENVADRRAIGDLADVIAAYGRARSS